MSFSVTPHSGETQQGQSQDHSITRRGMYHWQREMGDERACQLY